MTDRPIIFSTPMVRALLEGRKTQTRRLMPAPHPRFPAFNQIRTDVLTYDPQRPEAWYWDGVHDRVGASYQIRYAPGDRLYVRESIARQETDQGVGYQIYAADHSKVSPLTEWYHKRTAIPSIHMPRWASRITLTVTEVRVQRLQEISEADARAEGITQHRYGTPRNPSWTDCRTSFEWLWNNLHGPDAWDANPWVVAVSFTVTQGNIDALPNPERTLK